MPSARQPGLRRSPFLACAGTLLFLIIVMSSGIRAGHDISQPLKDSVRTIDCRRVVPRPVDSAPIRSPQAVHSIIATRVINQSIVEIGTRNGDGMACFAKFASSASAIEYDRKYCEELERRAAREGVQFDVQCQDFNLADLDADFITWWQQQPLTNLAALARLKQLRCSGKIRSTAEAILVFDMKWSRDMNDFHELIHFFSWYQEIVFDELDLCETFRLTGKDGSKESGFSCQRAAGKFIAAGFPVLNIPDNIFRCPADARKRS